MRIIPEAIQVFLKGNGKVREEIAQYKELIRRNPTYTQFYQDRIAVRERFLERRRIRKG